MYKTGLSWCLSGKKKKKKKKSTSQYRKHGFHPWVRKITWRRKWQSIPVVWPRKAHGQRSPMGYSP